MRKLYFEGDSWSALRELCENGYPKEACGLLLGSADENSSQIQKVVVLENILDGNHEARLQELIEMGTVTLPKARALKGGGTEFFIDPKEHFSKILQAQKNGLDQVGVFHSHPDHPAEPSPTDASQPMMAGWSSVIVSIEKGKFKEARSWFRNTEDSSFQEEDIVVK